MLTITDHRRDAAGLTYLYPVVSRRAGGISIGINLNTNNACNWACVYCQVENLRRGAPPPVDLPLLRHELDLFLDQTASGQWLQQVEDPAMRRLADVAFSGNGEPTSAVGFADAVAAVGDALAARDLLHVLPIRLITNGSLMYRPEVRAGLLQLGEAGGEAWFKLDRVGEQSALIINGVPESPARVRRNLETCLGLVNTWLQTCWFKWDGELPSAAEISAYCEFVRPFAGVLQGIHLYGLARPSQQSAAIRLQALTADELLAVAKQLENKTGIRVVANP